MRQRRLAAAGSALRSLRLTPERTKLIDQLLGQGVPRVEIARSLGISRSTLYAHIRQRKLAENVV